MRLPRRRLRPLRRLGRPARPAAAAPPPFHDAPTEFDAPAVLEDLPQPSTPLQRSQESTVELPAVREEIPQNDDSDPLRIEPPPPKKLEFNCACGAKLVATTETYDKHSRCAMCQTVMLLSLVYDGDQRSFEIVPFRVNPESGP